MSDRFKPGDRVVHVTASEVPENAKGTVLGRAGYPFEDKWEVEYDNHPCAHVDRFNAYPWMKSQTSWISRETSIELTREEALKRESAL